MAKDLGEELENIEEGIENLKNKEFRLLGMKMTPTTIGMAFAAIGSLLGALYAGFTMYQKVEEIANLDIGAYEEQMRSIDQKIDAQQVNIDTQSKLLKSIEDNLRDVKQLTYDVEKRMNSKVEYFESKMDKFEGKVDKNKKELEETIQKVLDNPLAN